jgi:hypothetical protein
MTTKAKNSAKDGATALALKELIKTLRSQREQVLYLPASQEMHREVRSKISWILRDLKNDPTEKNVALASQISTALQDLVDRKSEKLDFVSLFQGAGRRCFLPSALFSTRITGRIEIDRRRQSSRVDRDDVTIISKKVRHSRGKKALSATSMKDRTIVEDKNAGAGNGV